MSERRGKVTRRILPAVQKAAEERAERDGQPNLSHVIEGLLRQYAAGTVDVPLPEVDPRKAALVQQVCVDGVSVYAAAKTAEVAFATAQRWLRAAPAPADLDAWPTAPAWLRAEVEASRG